MAQYRFNCQHKDNCTECEYRGEHGCLAPRALTSGTKYVANKELVDEITKRFKFVEKAKEHMLHQNYGLARKLLDIVLYEPFSIKVED